MRLASVLCSAVLSAVPAGIQAGTPVPASLSDPDHLVLAFCERNASAHASCGIRTILRIPRIYLDADESSRVLDASDRINVQLSVQYPSFRPWRELSSWQRWFAPADRITLQLRGLTSQTVRDIHAGDFLGDPKATLSTSVHGLLHYQRHTWGLNDIYVPPGDRPNVHITCPSGMPEGRGDRSLCTVHTFTDWGLKVVYTHPRKLLPAWPATQQQVNSLIRSFQSDR